MPDIELRFDAHVTPRDRLHDALDKLPPVHCPDHPLERLEIDREATLCSLVHNHRLQLRAEHEHCAVCPFVTRDRTAFDEWERVANYEYVSEHGSTLGFETCAAFRRYSRLEPDFTASLQTAPRPTALHDAIIDPDHTPEGQLAGWLTGDGVRSCAFARAIGMDGSDSLPVRESSVTLRQAAWDGPAGDGAIVPAYQVSPVFAACPGCAVARYGVPPLFQQDSFDNFTIDPPAIVTHVAKCREFAANPQGFLLMLGSVGNGKTHLATAIARARLPGRRVLFLSHDGFLTRYRARYAGVTPATSRSSDDDGRPVDVLAEACKARLLIFDDLGRRHAGRDEESLLYSLFNHRYEHRLPTIITANLPPSPFEEVVGTALFDRMCEASFAVLEFNFPSKRRALNHEYLAHL